MSAILLLSAVSLPAQDAAADSGAFVVRRARDTVAVERFTRTATKLEGTLTLRNPKRTSERYSAVIAPDATIPLIEVTTREGADTGSRGAKVVQRARVIFKEDSVAVDEMSGAGLMTRVFGTEAGAVPYLNLSFALLEQAVLRARAKADQSQLAFFNLGGGQTITARVTGVGRDSLTMDIGDVRYRLKVDQKGRVLGARIPDQNVVVDRM
ncbi:MAG TPA: hypothetical protein VIG95_10645 [Gemmatimonadales bacterium]